jgi:hypothetical protein
MKPRDPRTDSMRSLAGLGADEVRPTAAPAAMAGGIMLLFSGITMHWLFSLFGGLVFLAALGRWIAEIGRQGNEAGQSSAQLRTEQPDEARATQRDSNAPPGHGARPRERTGSPRVSRPTDLRAGGIQRVPGERAGGRLSRRAVSQARPVAVANGRLACGVRGRRDGAGAVRGSVVAAVGRRHRSQRRVAAGAPARRSSSPSPSTVATSAARCGGCRMRSCSCAPATAACTTPTAPSPPVRRPNRSLAIRCASATAWSSSRRSRCR